MKRVFVHGLGLWTPGFGGLPAWLEQKFDASIETPAAELLEGSLRRRATPLTRMAVEVFAQALLQARRPPESVLAVWATAHGEHTPAIKLLEMMQRGEGKLSPTHFHNSVHNTAGGYASIATGNVEISTTHTGGTELVGSALFDAWCLLESRHRDVVVVIADEALQSPFDSEDARTPLALSLLLSGEAHGALAALVGLRREDGAPLEDHPRFGHLHASAALPLLERIAGGLPGRVALELSSGRAGPVWCVELASR